MSTLERPAKRAKLLSDNSSSSESEDDDNANATANGNGFKVNKDYAKRFEHNKKRDELQRLEEKYGKDADREENESEDSEDEESEDDQADLATKDVDEEIFATLQAIKSKDPRVYDERVKFYKDYEGEGGEGRAKDERTERPMYLQDYHRQNLLDGYTGDEVEQSEAAPHTYQGEQDRLRRELVGSMHASANGGAEEDDDEDEDEDDFLVAKPRSKAKHAAVSSAAQPRTITEQDIASADKDPETYLSNFMAARAWLPSATSKWQAFDSDDSEDEDRADAFEDAYNMRFEDPATANERLQSFARDVGKYGARREEKGGRKRAREREREDKEAQSRERQEERARLRKLRIEEAEEKVKKIKDAAGLKGKELDVAQWRDVIEGDFDDDKWEVEMKRRFGDEYYEEDEEAGDSDVDVEAGYAKKQRLHKPKWDDDIDINDLVPDFEQDDGQPAFTLSSDEEETEEIEHRERKGKTKKDRLKEKAEAKRTARRERMQIEELVDSSLPLTVATATTNSASGAPGFRYRDTSPTSFGLSARDILFADDAQLNQYAGLKKMAAFRDAGKKQKDKKRYSKKARLREWRKETFGSKEEPAGGFDRVLGGRVSKGRGEGEESKKKRKRSGRKEKESVKD